MCGGWAEVASACAWSVALSGVEGRLVEVEADIGAGLPRTVLVGLPDSALYQSLYRLEARRAITADWGVTEKNRRARYYSITPAGRAELRAETARWNRYAETVTGILNTPQQA